MPGSEGIVAGSKRREWEPWGRKEGRVLVVREARNVGVKSVVPTCLDRRGAIC